MREIVSMWLGQAGVQLGHACWELFSLEHAIAPDGSFFEYDNNENSYEHFFKMAHSGNVVPRCVLVDLEPSVIDEIKVGNFRRLFSPDSLINGMEDAANNFARGFNASGRTVIRDVVNTTRRTTESCESNAGFMIHHSFGGGTGSGFTCTLLEYLQCEYAKTPKIEFGIFPSKMLNTSIVEPYNATLAMHTPMENADIACFFDNESLFRIFTQNLDWQNITYSNINKLVAQVLSGATASLRFEGPLNANIIDCQTNLVPYPRIHFPLISFCPVLSPIKLTHDASSTKEVTECAFSTENQMSSVKPYDGAYMSCVMFYRGDVSVLDVNSAISHIKQTWKIPWVDWCPTGFKIGINLQPMLPVPGSGLGYCPRALTMLSNTTAVRQIVSNINHKFWMLYDKKSFIHWYLAEGMEECEFTEAFEDMVLLEKDYEVIENTLENDHYPETVPVTHVSSSSSSSSDQSSGEDADKSGSNVNMFFYDNQSNPFISEHFWVNSCLPKRCEKNQINIQLEEDMKNSYSSNENQEQSYFTNVEVEDSYSPIITATATTSELFDTTSTSIYSAPESPLLHKANQIEISAHDDQLTSPTSLNPIITPRQIPTKALLVSTCNIVPTNTNTHNLISVEISF